MFIENIDDGEEAPSTMEMINGQKRKSSHLKINTTSQFQISFTQSNLINKKEKDCRVCLDNSDEVTNPLIVPCGCTGSIRYIHQQCFKQWVFRLYQESQGKDAKDQRDYSTCQLCKQQYKMTIKKEFCCSTSKQIESKIKTKVLLFVILITSIIINVICLGFFIQKVFTKIADTTSHIIMGVILSVFVLLCTTFFFTTFFLVKQYFVSQDVRINLKKDTLELSSIKCRIVHPQV